MALESKLAQDVEERQIAMFASYVGKSRFTTFVALSAASKIPDSTLRSYAGGAAMPFHAVLALRTCLPNGAINMLAEPGGARLVDIEASEANWNAVAAGAAGLTYEICEAQRDGQVNHVERARLKNRARTLVADLSDIIAEE